MTSQKPTTSNCDMKKSMSGKVAIVTASSTGIGKAIVERLGEEGCKVVVSSRNRKHID
jgi:dehydrogenase/reductase SDR family protein 4